MRFVRDGHTTADAAKKLWEIKCLSFARANALQEIKVLALASETQHMPACVLSESVGVYRTRTDGKVHPDGTGGSRVNRPGYFLASRILTDYRRRLQNLPAEEIGRDVETLQGVEKLCADLVAEHQAPGNASSV